MWLLYFLCLDPSKHPQACAACLPVTAAILPSAASFMLQPEPWRRPHKEIKRGLRLADTLWPITHLFFVCEKGRVVASCLGWGELGGAWGPGTSRMCDRL